MHLSGKLTLLSALVLAAAFSCGAENRFCIGGNPANVTANERSICAQRMEDIQTIMKRNNSVNDWHFVVVCGESGWREYSDFAHNDELALDKSNYETISEERTTYLRADKMDATAFRLVLADVAKPATGQTLIASNNK